MGKAAERGVPTRTEDVGTRLRRFAHPTQPDLSTLLNQSERVAVADDAAAGEMPAEHEGRRAGEAREQVAPGAGGLRRIEVDGRGPVEPRHLARMVRHV